MSNEKVIHFRSAKRYSKSYEWKEKNAIGDNLKLNTNIKSKFNCYHYGSQDSLDSKLDEGLAIMLTYISIKVINIFLPKK